MVTASNGIDVSPDIAAVAGQPPPQTSDGAKIFIDTVTADNEVAPTSNSGGGVKSGVGARKQPRRSSIGSTAAVSEQPADKSAVGVPPASTSERRVDDAELPGLGGRDSGVSGQGAGGATEASALESDVASAAASKNTAQKAGNGRKSGASASVAVPPATEPEAPAAPASTAAAGSPALAPTAATSGATGPATKSVRGKKGAAAASAGDSGLTADSAPGPAADAADVSAPAATDSGQNEVVGPAAAVAAKKPSRRKSASSSKTSSAASAAMAADEADAAAAPAAMGTGVQPDGTTSVTQSPVPDGGDGVAAGANPPSSSEASSSAEATASESADATAAAGNKRKATPAKKPVGKRSGGAGAAMASESMVDASAAAASPSLIPALATGSTAGSTVEAAPAEPKRQRRAAATAAVAGIKASTAALNAGSKGIDEDSAAADGEDEDNNPADVGDDDTDDDDAERQPAKRKKGGDADGDAGGSKAPDSEKMKRSDLYALLIARAEKLENAEELREWSIDDVQNLSMARQKRSAEAAAAAAGTGGGGVDDEVRKALDAFKGKNRTRKESFKCPWCGCTKGTLPGIQYHVKRQVCRVNRAKGHDAARRQNETDNPAHLMFACPLCNKQFTSQPGLRHHLLRKQKCWEEEDEEYDAEIDGDDQPAVGAAGAGAAGDGQALASPAPCIKPSKPSGRRKSAASRAADEAHSAAIAESFGFQSQYASSFRALHSGRDSSSGGWDDPAVRCHSSAVMSLSTTEAAPYLHSAGITSTATLLHPFARPWPDSPGLTGDAADNGPADGGGGSALSTAPGAAAIASQRQGATAASSVFSHAQYATEMLSQGGMPASPMQGLQLSIAPGPIWALDVTSAPSPVNGRLQSFVAVSQHALDRSLHAIGRVSSGKNVIQIWETVIPIPKAGGDAGGDADESMGVETPSSASSSSSTASASLSMLIAHDCDTVVDLQWCPHVRTDEARVGILAAAFGDGAVRVYSVPRTVSNRSAASSASASSAAASSTVPILFLVPLAVCGATAQPATCLRWSTAERGLLVVGTAAGTLHLYRVGPGGDGGSHDDDTLSATTALSAAECGFRCNASTLRTLLSTGLACRRLYPEESLAALHSLVLPPTTAAVRDVAVSPVSPHVIAAVHNDGICRIWDVRYPDAPLADMSVTTRQVLSIDFSAHGQHLYLAADTGDVTEVNLADWSTDTLVCSPSFGDPRAPAWEVRVLHLPPGLPTVSSTDCILGTALGNGGCFVFPPLANVTFRKNLLRISSEQSIEGSKVHSAVRSKYVGSTGLNATSMAKAAAAAAVASLEEGARGDDDEDGDNGAGRGAGAVAAGGKSSSSASAAAGSSSSSSSAAPSRGGKTKLGPDLLGARAASGVAARDMTSVGSFITPVLPPSSNAVASFVGAPSSSMAATYLPQMGMHRVRMAAVVEPAGATTAAASSSSSSSAAETTDSQLGRTPQVFAVVACGGGAGVVYLRGIDVSRDYASASFLRSAREWLLAAAARTARPLSSGAADGGVASKQRKGKPGLLRNPNRSLGVRRHRGGPADAGKEWKQRELTKNGSSGKKNRGGRAKSKSAKKQRKGSDWASDDEEEEFDASEEEEEEEEDAWDSDDSDSDDEEDLDDGDDDDSEDDSDSDGEYRARASKSSRSKAPSSSSAEAIPAFLQKKQKRALKRSRKAMEEDAHDDNDEDDDAGSSEDSEAELERKYGAAARWAAPDPAVIAAQKNDRAARAARRSTGLGSELPTTSPARGRASAAAPSSSARRRKRDEDEEDTADV